MFDKKNKTSDTKENSTDKEFAALKEKDKNKDSLRENKFSIEDIILQNAKLTNVHEEE